MMQKQRSRGRNYIRTPKVRSHYNFVLKDYELKSKSVQNIKYADVLRNSGIKRRSSKHADATHVKFDFFDSLQSLFNEKKVIDFSKIDYARFHTNDIKNCQTSISIEKNIQVSTDELEEVNNYSFDILGNAKNSIKMDDEKNVNEEENSEIIQQENPAALVSPENPDNDAVAEGVDDKNDSVEISEAIQNDDIVEPPRYPIPDEDDKNDSVEISEAIQNDDITEPPRYPIPDEFNQGVPIKPGGHTDSIQSSNPMTDTAIMAEMTLASERSQALTDEIKELKAELDELQQKPDLSDEDRETFEKKKEKVMEKMGELESMTRNIQKIIGLVDPTDEVFAKAFELFPLSHKRDHGDLEEGEKEDVLDKWDGEEIMNTENMFDLPQPQFTEDSLPRVIVCGYTEEKIPKIVVADSLREKSDRWLNSESPTFKLTETLNMQEKTAKKDDNYGGCTYRKSEVIRPEKDHTVENLQLQVCGLQTEMQIFVKENADLKCQIALLNEKVGNPLRNFDSPRNKDETCICTDNATRQLKKSACGSVRLSGGGSNGISREKNTKVYYQNPIAFSMASPGSCPAEMQNKLNNYQADTTQLECQLGTMESEIHHMKMNLTSLQRERQQLEQQRKLLNCAGPCAPCPCNPPPHTPSLNQGLCATSPACQDVCASQKSFDENSCSQQQIGDLREKYSRLREDYKNKLCEVSCLRRDAEKLKQESREAKSAKDCAINQLTDLQERLKSYENNKNKFGGRKEEVVEQEQALIVTKQRYREAQEELEELRALLEDQSYQLEDYRNKYLQAQEQVEEQKRLLDLMEIDNARMNENVTLEIGRVKNQFQEKLAELAPLPDILRNTQMMLQESQQQRINAERSCEDLSRQLANCKGKLDEANSQLEKLQKDYAILNGEKGSGSDRLDDIQMKKNQLENENEQMKNELSRLEAEHKGEIEEKLHEIVQLRSLLEELREDSARQVARVKERCETIRKNMQVRISDLENELAKCRALSKSAEKERDEIRMKMQSQINRLNESFDQAQGRVKTLQGHVDYLKTSYSNVFTVGGHGEGQPSLFGFETQSQSPYDTCDCTH